MNVGLLLLSSNSIMLNAARDGGMESGSPLPVRCAVSAGRGDRLGHRVVVGVWEKTDPHRVSRPLSRLLRKHEIVRYV
jgi:hypothetical protein